MDPELWAHVESLYHAAMARDPSERLSFLDSACDGDTELRREVDSLLAHEGKADGLLEQPVWKAAEASAVLAPGTRAGAYEIQELLGRGGMGEVYKAHDIRLKRPVAIKVLGRSSGLCGESSRFLEEARAASALSHPNIVHVYQLESHEGEDLIVMEFLAGQTVAAMLRDRRFSPGQVLEYARQIASALAASHSAGIVHRDIKPANIIADESGQLKLVDFGLAKFVHRPAAGETTITATAAAASGSIVGTASYMSPELAEGKPADSRSDIFSTGAVLYEMLTGTRAFEDDSPVAVLAKVIHFRPRPIRDVRREVPSALARVVDRCMEKDPAKRYGSGQELLEALSACQPKRGFPSMAFRAAWPRR
jgi:serine/threonine protein kinase